MGLRIYREVMYRENRCAAAWHVNYGPEALQKKPDPMTMINLGKFSKFASVPMPLDVQRTPAPARNCPCLMQCGVSRRTHVTARSCAPCSA